LPKELSVHPEISGKRKEAAKHGTRRCEGMRGVRCEAGGVRSEV
jgi:hypothetical protein